MKNKFNSSVLHEGYVYGLDEGILTCLDVNTGARKWKGGRYGYGQVILASGHLIVMSDAGELALVKLRPRNTPRLPALPRCKVRPGTIRRSPVDAYSFVTRTGWLLIRSPRNSLTALSADCDKLSWSLPLPVLTLCWPTS